MSLLHRTKTPAQTEATEPKVTEPDAAEPTPVEHPDIAVAPDAAPATLATAPNLWSWLDSWGPMIEERRDGGELVVRFEMPGLDPDEDVEITVTDGVLRIRAEHEEETTDDETGRRTQMRYGSYTRTMTLPPGTTEDDVKASYLDGVLEVHVPVDDRTTTAKKVPVTTG
jgi:HSP20 family protein